MRRQPWYLNDHHKPAPTTNPAPTIKRDSKGNVITTTKQWSDDIEQQYSDYLEYRAGT
jgi:hypothetical protein